jgi:dTDP-glucose 4,6-dehydratase
LGTHNLLGLARVKGARMLIASTSEVYGDPEIHPQVEEYFGNVNPVGPRGCYDEAKRFQEAITMAYHNHHGLETRIIRIFNTYGPRMRLDDGRVLPAFLPRPCAGRTSPYSATAPKPARSATSTTWWKAFTACSSATTTCR